MTKEKRICKYCGTDIEKGNRCHLCGKKDKIFSIEEGFNSETIKEEISFIKDILSWREEHKISLSKKDKGEYECGKAEGYKDGLSFFFLPINETFIDDNIKRIDFNGKKGPLLLKIIVVEEGCNIKEKIEVNNKEGELLVKKVTSTKELKERKGRLEEELKKCKSKEAGTNENKIKKAIDLIKREKGKIIATIVPMSIFIVLLSLCIWSMAEDLTNRGFWQSAILTACLVVTCVVCLLLLLVKYITQNRELKKELEGLKREAENFHEFEVISEELGTIEGKIKEEQKNISTQASLLKDLKERIEAKSEYKEKIKNLEKERDELKNELSSLKTENEEKNGEILLFKDWIYSIINLAGNESYRNNIVNNQLSWKSAFEKINEIETLNSQGRFQQSTNDGFELIFNKLGIKRKKHD